VLSGGLAVVNSSPTMKGSNAVEDPLIIKIIPQTHI
jgi:hypothetical protein